MSFNAGKVTGQLDLDAKGFIQALSRATKALDKMGKNVKKSGAGFGSFAKNLAVLRDLMLVLPGIIRGVTAPLKSLIGFLKESSQAAADMQQSVRNLAVSLSLQGVSNVGTVTKELEEFAQAMQDSTQHSRTMTLSIAKTLSILGVQSDTLVMSTKAVLDYSSATGRDALQSAFQFGKTMAGMLGELRETFPVLSVLTEEQLKAGEAFKFTTEILGDFSRKVADTTQGLRKRLINAFLDLKIAVGDAINPVLDALTKAGIGAVKVIVGMARQNKAAMTDMFKGMATSLLATIDKIADTSLNVPIWIANVKLFIAQVIGVVKIGSLELSIIAKDLAFDIQKTIANLIEAFSRLPFMGELRKTSSEMKKDLGQIAGEIAKMKSESDATKFAIEQVARAAEDVVTETEAASAAIRDNVDKTSTLAKLWRGVHTFTSSARQNMDEMVTHAREQEGVTININRGLAKRLEMLREMTGMTRENLLPATKTLADVIALAADQTSRMRQEAEGAAGAFDDASAAASGIGGGGVGGAGGDDSGRRAGGSLGLDTSDVFSTLQSLGQARRSINRTGGIFGGIQARSARAVADQMAAVARAQVNQALAQFNSDLVSELSRLGIFDPTERNQFIQARTREAERLGTIPTANAVRTAGFGGNRF